MPARDRGASFLAVLTVRSRSPRCPPAAFVFAALALLAVGISKPAIAADGPTSQPATQPAGDDHNIEITSDNGVMKLRLPARWTKTTPETGYAISAQYHDAESADRLVVASHTQEDFVDFKSFANYTHNYWMRYYEHTESTEAREIEVGGQPAIRYDITYVTDGCRMGMVQLFTQTST